MKLSELLKNQRITIQLIWGEQKIEFFSNVIENSEAGVFVSPYLHNGSPLELNVKNDKGVLCSVFTLNPQDKHRVSWKNVELSTVRRGRDKVYLIRTNSFNYVAKQDDRRLYERVSVSVNATALDVASKMSIDVTLNDISDEGISFFMDPNFNMQSNLLEVSFTDKLGDKEFNVKVECMVARVEKAAGSLLVGCRVIVVNRDYQLYSFMLRLLETKKNN